MRRTQVFVLAVILLAPALMGATPTPTPEPTKVTMPEGWASIAETREIGGRQVVLNEKGEAATEIDGEWYPVDAKGCYYEELLSPEVQNDPKLVEAHNKLIGELSYTMEGKSAQYPRYLGSTMVGITGGEYPAIYDRLFDARIVGQKLCYQNGTWYHVTDQAMAVFKEIAPNDSIFMRGVVGWFEGSQYKTFTYLEKTNERVKGNLDLTNASIEKAGSFEGAYRLWEKIIMSDFQVGLRLPMGIRDSENGVSEGSYSQLLTQLLNSVHGTIPRYWSSSIEDNLFEDWAKTKNNQEEYFSSEKNSFELFRTNRSSIWKTWMNEIVSGKMPIPYIRTITTEK